MISAYDIVFSSVVSDLELSELILSLLPLSSSTACTLLLFSSGDFLGSLLFEDIELKGVKSCSKSEGEVDAEYDSDELGVGTEIEASLLGN